VRDGLSSLGDFNASSQYYQTLHGKRLIGGYLSRVSDRHKAYTRRQPVLSALMRLSEGKPLTETQATRARRFARRFAEAADVAYVVMDRRRVTPELRTFAIELLRLDLVESSGVFDLYVPRPR
jgi:hypothetical protein